MADSSQKQPPSFGGWPLLATGAGLAVLTAASAAAWYLAQPAPTKDEPESSKARAIRIADRKAKRELKKAAEAEAATSERSAKFPTRPTAVDLHEAIAVLGGTEPSSKQAMWRSCGVLAILCGHAKIRTLLGESEQEPVIDTLIAMVKSGDIVDACAACEVLLMLLGSDLMRKRVIDGGAVTCIIKTVCEEVTRALTGGGASSTSVAADSSASSAASDVSAAGSSDLCCLPVGLLADVAGAASMDFPAQVSNRTLAELMEAATSVMGSLATDPSSSSSTETATSLLADTPSSAASASSTVVPQAIRAIGIRRCLSLLVNLTASDEGTPALLAAMASHEAIGGVAILVALSSLHRVPGLQVTALKLLSNMAADIATGNTGSKPNTDGSPGSSLDELLIKLVCPLVRCASRMPRATGAWGQEQLLRLVSVVGSSIAPLVASRGVQAAGVAGKVSLTHLKVAEAIKEAGAVRVLSSCLVECSDRMNRFEAAVRRAGPQARLTQQQQGQIAAADETVKGSARVLNTLAAAFPEVKSEVERIAEELATLARSGTAADPSAMAARGATTLPASVQEEDEEEEEDDDDDEEDDDDVAKKD